MIVQHRLTVPTRGRGTYDITAQVSRVVRGAGIAIGLCHVFCHSEGMIDASELRGKGFNYRYSQTWILVCDGRARMTS